MKLRIEIVIILFLNEVFLFSCSEHGSGLTHSPNVCFLKKDSIYSSQFVMALPNKTFIPVSVKSIYNPHKNDTLDLSKGKTNHGQSNADSVKVPAGAMYMATLPDSTMISLNAGSKLSFKHSAIKDVEIMGEGFFETNKTGRKLKIKADSITIEEAAGSSVNVFNFTNEKEIAISLLKGNIVVKNGGCCETYHAPGTLIRINRQTRQLTQQPCEIEQIAAWRLGKFYFPHTGLYSLLNYIGRWYNREILFSDSVAAGDFHISLWYYMSLNDIIKILEHTCDIRCELGNKGSDRYLRVKASSS